MAPVGPDGQGEVDAVAGRAPGIGHHDQVAVGREQLAGEVEGVVVLGLGTPVEPQHGRVASARLEGRGLVEERLDRRPVPAAETDLFDPGQGDPRQQLFVDPGELTQPGEVLGARDEEIGRSLRVADQGHHRAFGTHRRRLDHPRPGDDPGHLTPGDGHARELNLAVILEQEEHRRSVGGEPGPVDVAVQGRGQHPGVASAGRDHRQVGLGVVDDLRASGGLVGDQRAVRMPDRRAVRTGVAGESRRFGVLAGLGDVHQPEVRVVVGVRLLGAVADEGDDLPSGHQTGSESSKSPDVICRFAVPMSKTYRCRDSGRGSRVVALELQPVDDPGSDTSSLWSVFLLLGLRSRSTAPSSGCSKPHSKASIP